MNHFIGNANIRFDDGINKFELSKKSEAMCDNYIKTACYDLQQAMEFYLKGIIYLQGNIHAENHDLRAQLNRIEGPIPEIDESLDLIRENALTFNEWESKSRYDFNFVATIRDIEIAIGICEKLHKYCNNLIKVD